MVDGRVVVDALDLEMRLARFLTGSERRLRHEVCHELLAQEEEVVLAGGVDRHHIIRRYTGVVDVNEVVGPAAADVDHHRIGAFAAVDIDRVPDHLARNQLRRRDRRQAIERDQVRAAHAEDLRVADQRLGSQGDGVGRVVALDLDARRLQRAIDHDGGARGIDRSVGIDAEDDRRLGVDERALGNGQVVAGLDVNRAGEALDGHPGFEQHVIV